LWATNYLFIGDIQIFNQTSSTSTTTVEVGPASSGADYICDAYADDIEIQYAIDYVASKGGGTVNIIGSGDQDNPLYYYLKKEIFMQDNVTLQMVCGQEIEAGAVLKKSAGVISSLSQNYIAGSNKIYLENASGFVPGMTIGLPYEEDNPVSPSSDELSVISGVWTQILAVNGNELTIYPVINETETEKLMTDSLYCFSNYNLVTAANNNITITGGGIDGNSHGPYLNGADRFMNCIGTGGTRYNIEISNIELFDSGINGGPFSGLHVCGIVYDMKIDSCTVTNQVRGIIFDCAGGSIICSNNNCNSNGTGIVIGNGSDILISSCNLSHNTNGGIGVYGGGQRNITIENCTLNSNGKVNDNEEGVGFGIEIDNTDDVIINNCTIDGTISDKKQQYGIHLTNSKNIFINLSENGKEITNCQTGIYEGNVEGEGEDEKDYFTDDYTHIESCTFSNCGNNTKIIGFNSELDNGTPEFVELSDDVPITLPDQVKYNSFQIDLKGNSVFNEGTVLHSGPMNIQVRTDTNILGKYGNIDNIYIAEENSTYGYLHIRGSGDLVNYPERDRVDTIDSNAWLDCNYSSTFSWSNNYADYNCGSNYINFPSIAGHKYLIRLKVLGNFKIEEVDTDNCAIISGEKLPYDDYTSWETEMFTAVGTGKDIVYLLRSQFGSSGWDAGYCRDIMILDLTERGEAGLSDETIFANYDEGNCVDPQIITTTLSVPVTLRSIGSTQDELQWDGTLTQRVAYKEMADTDFAQVTELNNVSIVTTTACLPGVVQQQDGIDDTVWVFGKTEVALQDIDNANNIGKYATFYETGVGSKIKFIITKGMSLNDFKASLTGSPIALNYTLETPVTSTVSGMDCLVALGGSQTEIDCPNNGLIASPDIICTCPENISAKQAINDEVKDTVSQDQLEALGLSPLMPASIDISGSGSITIPGSGTTTTSTFTAAVEDQFGDNMTNETVKWSIYGNATGISISEDGIVTVESNAVAGPFVIKAVSDTNSTVVGMKIVMIVK